jgi:hypothetical protein
MKSLFLSAAMVLATLMASPALAQSQDPSVGSGNMDRSVPTAPQPRLSDVPSTNTINNRSEYGRELNWDRVLKICRNC